MRYSSSCARGNRKARELFGNIAAGEVRNPAFLVGEQTDRDEIGRFAHIEPMPGAVGYADQVALHAQRFVHLVADMQGELAAAGDEETHFVFRVRVFVEELRTQR